jgi:rhodanese-related sulfurtransferase
MTRQSRRTPIRLGLILLLLGASAEHARAEAPPLLRIEESVLESTGQTPEVSTVEFRKLLEDGSVVVLDARPPEEYAISHVPGALNAPAGRAVPASQYVADVDAVARMVPDRARTVVLYCSGPFCKRSKRLAVELTGRGYTRVVRYQLGIPVWRALGGVTQVERSAIGPLLRQDRTAVLVDARPVGERDRQMTDARLIPADEVESAKDDGRLPMTDHNTRILVVGSNGPQARTTAEHIARNAFHNVSFYGGKVSELTELFGSGPGGAR